MKIGKVIWINSNGFDALPSPDYSTTRKTYENTFGYQQSFAGEQSFDIFSW